MLEDILNLLFKTFENKIIKNNYDFNTNSHYLLIGL